MFMLIVFGFTVPDRSGLFRILVPPERGACGFRAVLSVQDQDDTTQRKNVQIPEL